MQHAVFSRLSIAFALLFSLWGSVAHANEYDEVNLLLRQGKATEALAKADTYIAGKPRDPQMRFLRGVILTEQNKQPEAIIAFTQLTQDFPELPEPYNNLAALYASQSKFDQARAALETALRLNPNYATAHENLGDVYARLAAQEYVKAQQFASTNASVAPKLVLIRQIFSSKAEAEAATLPAAPAVIRKPVGRSSK
ncbi:tetratricopeptide repeat protein [Variovorax sp. RKNM96]|uniref:tetratricopeptide repeat protein n=1 Tax=Variovorax sp. RKNM96 TaxID=2681552 RepID=UPI00197F73F6|nr:tetratricopeptide repeat protein [Variovorax sp. RKNM96]QSI30562.1 tetratricopeptide repeat protein [Variovorax sp. RKNM96]